MSLFRYSDYKEDKNQTKYMKKTRLPTQEKTKKHKCSRCERTDAIRYPLNEKECVWLCPDCKRKYDAQFSPENKAYFVRASKLYEL